MSLNLIPYRKLEEKILLNVLFTKMKFSIFTQVRLTGEMPSSIINCPILGISLIQEGHISKVTTIKE